jgi:phosphatidylserine decarboxylase
MGFHREGYVSLIIVLAFGALLSIPAYVYLAQWPFLQYLAYALSAFLLIVILQFFRNPFFKTTQSEKGIVCPADGKVVVIEEVDEPEFLKTRCLQISVFMSPINVHVNRNPISGKVDDKYHPGKYLVAWHPKSSTENERTTIVVQHANGTTILFRQIAGALARRIKYYVHQNDVVKQGEEFGFIKFGSRVDVFLPLNTDIKVNIGDVVKGGRTILAELK